MFFHTLYFIPIYFGTLLLFAAGGFELCVLGLLAGALPASERSERFFQRLIQRHLAFFHWWCDLTRLVHVRYHGFETSPAGGRVLVANHPAMIDITCLLARLPGAVCIFKPAIRRNPVLGAAARCAGYLGSDGGHELVRNAAEKTAAGIRWSSFRRARARRRARPCSRSNRASSSSPAAPTCRSSSCGSRPTPISSPRALPGGGCRACPPGSR